MEGRDKRLREEEVEIEKQIWGLWVQAVRLQYAYSAVKDIYYYHLSIS